MQYKTILITGGAGFVGSNLSIKFKENYPNIKIIAVDNLRRRGSELNLERLKKYGVEFIHGDIRNKEDLQSVSSFDLMIECSAEPSVLSGYNESPEYLINTNLIGTVNCLEMARKNKADIIFLSTSRVYPFKTINSLEYEELETRFELKPIQSIEGVSQKGITEKFPLNGVRSLYGTTKLASELLLQEYIDAYGLRGVINRCGVITGPWQMGKVDQGFVVLWIARHIYGGELSYLGYGGKGKQVRDIIYINDLYELLDLQIKNIDRCNAQIYNIGGGKNISVSLKELTKICEEVTGNIIKIKSVSETRIVDIPYYITDFTKAQTEIGWTPRYSVIEIIEEIAKWIYNNKELLRSILA